MNSQKVNLSTPNILGGIGGIFLVIGFLSNFLELVGLVLVLVAFYQYSQILNKPSIFQYGLSWGIFFFVTRISLIFFAGATITSTFTSIFTSDFTSDFSIYRDISVFLAIVGALLTYGAAIFAAIKLKKVLIELSIILNRNLCDITVKFIYWGAILSIVLIGVIATYIGIILLTVAFFTAQKEIQLNNTEEKS